MSHDARSPQHPIGYQSASKRLTSVYAASAPTSRTQAGAQGRGWCLTLLLVHRREAAGDIVVQFVAVIPVIGQHRVDLAQREVRDLDRPGSPACFGLCAGWR